MGVSTSGRQGQPRIGASPASVATLALLSFLAGAAGGAVAHSELARGSRAPARAAEKPDSWKADQVERWTKTLDLNASQRNRLEAALDTVHSRYRLLFNEIEPKKHEIDLELKAQIAAFLDAKQRARYEAALAETEARRQVYYGLRDARAIANPIKSAAGAGDAEGR
jgi:hypothetical protein